MPDGVKVISQRSDWDCGVAAIAMLLGVPYKDVLAVVKEMYDPKQLKRTGLILRQMEEVIENRFGLKVDRRYRRDGYLDGASGILGLNGGDCAPHGHWVVIKDGLILDPSGGEAWAPDDYMKAGKCRPATLIVLS